MTTITYTRGATICHLTCRTADLQRELRALGTSVVILSSVPQR